MPETSSQVYKTEEKEAQGHSSDERTWAALAHASTLLNAAVGFGGLISAGVIWLTKKEESAWVAFHAAQSLVFQSLQLLVTLVVVGGSWVLGFAFSFLTLGFGTFIAVPLMFLTFFLGMLIMFGGVAYSLYGAFQIYNGQAFSYLWVGDWVAQRSHTQGENKPRATVAPAASKNVTTIIIVIAVVLVLGLLCAFLGLVGLSILGGAFFLLAEAPAVLIGG